MQLPKLHKKGRIWYFDGVALKGLTPRRRNHHNLWKFELEEIEAILKQYLKLPTKELHDAIIFYSEFYNAIYDADKTSMDLLDMPNEIRKSSRRERYASKDDISKIWNLSNSEDTGETVQNALQIQGNKWVSNSPKEKKKTNK